MRNFASIYLAVNTLLYLAIAYQVWERRRDRNSSIVLTITITAFFCALVLM